MSRFLIGTASDDIRIAIDQVYMLIIFRKSFFIKIFLQFWKLSTCICYSGLDKFSFNEGTLAELTVLGSNNVLASCKQVSRMICRLACFLLLHNGRNYKFRLRIINKIKVDSSKNSFCPCLPFSPKFWKTFKKLVSLYNVQIIHFQGQNHFWACFVLGDW